MVKVVGTGTKRYSNTKAKVIANLLPRLKSGGHLFIGHSERRQYFGETDFTVNKKVLAALEAGLHPIICVGESLEQRELGITMELIALQVKSALAGVPAEKVRKCVIAYEPIWAIGTGKTATAEQAAEVCTFIRTTVRHLYGARIARSVTVQYGGSMKPSNARELLAELDIDIQSFDISRIVSVYSDRAGVRWWTKAWFNNREEGEASVEIEREQAVRFIQDRIEKDAWLEEFFPKQMEVYHNAIEQTKEQLLKQINMI